MSLASGAQETVRYKCFYKFGADQKAFNLTIKYRERSDMGTSVMAEGTAYLVGQVPVGMPKVSVALFGGPLARTATWSFANVSMSQDGIIMHRGVRIKCM